MRSVRAEIDEEGKVRLLDGLTCSSKKQAVVFVLEEGEEISDAALLSESALARDWDRPEEDVAWSHLKSDQ